MADAPHVHFKVFLGGNEVVASQIFFPDEITREVFSTWQPYRQHASKRTTFNNNDPIKQGVHSEMTTIRTISGVLVPMVYRMPVMRPCPPAGTANCRLHGNQISSTINAWDDRKH